jgi:hypothetical protein
LAEAITYWPLTPTKRLKFNSGRQIQLLLDAIVAKQLNWGAQCLPSA